MILAIVYSLLLLFSVARSLRVRTFASLPPKLFYANLCIQILIYSIFFWVLFISVCKQMDNTGLSLLTLIPSIMMMLTYYMMFLLLIQDMQASRSAKANAYQERMAKNRVVKALIIVSVTLVVLFVIGNITDLILCAVSMDKDQIRTLNIIFSATWFTVILWIIISVLVIYVKQSGLPYKSEKHKAKVRYIAIVFGVWTTALVIKFGLAIFSFEYIIRDYN